MPIRAATEQWRQPKGTVRQCIDWELPRKLYHSVQGVLVLALYICYPDASPHDFLPALVPPFLLYFYLDHRRLQSERVNRTFTAVVGITMREDERTGRRLTSSSAYMAGVLLTLCWWPMQQAALICLYLAWVDTAAAFGGRLGTLLLGDRNIKTGVVVDLLRVRRSKKSICGFIAASATAGAIYAWMQGHSGREWTSAQALLAGLIGGVAETVTVGGVDDDLSLPVIAGCLLAPCGRLLGLS